MSLLKRIFLPIEMNDETVESAAKAKVRSENVRCKAKVSHSRFCDVLFELNQILEKKDPKEANE